MGQIYFPNSGSPEAQESFVRAVLLLHSFEYEDAREAFGEAQAIDPDFALAYWGEAMTHNHPLWKQQDQEAAVEALARLAATPKARRKRAKTDRERAYLHAVEQLYGDGDKVERDIAYSEAMGQAARYPDDLEARAFYALSILGTVQGERDFGVYMRAGAVAEEVFAANELHPGAAHYMIHSYDDPVHAPLGIRASLLAMIEMDRGSTDTALTLFAEATAAEEGLPMEFGPPIIVKPSHGRSLAGLVRAAQASGNAKIVAKRCAEIASIYTGADESVVRPEACKTGSDVKQTAAQR